MKNKLTVIVGMTLLPLTMAMADTNGVTSRGTTPVPESQMVTPADGVKTPNVGSDSVNQNYPQDSQKQPANTDGTSTDSPMKHPTKHPVENDSNNVPPLSTDKSS